MQFPAHRKEFLWPLPQGQEPKLGAEAIRNLRIETRGQARDNRVMIRDIAVTPSQPTTEQDAVDMLLACHSRIRNFTAIAERIAEVGQNAAPAEVANAAEAVHRYYTVALPLHEADENETVYPRLRQAMTDAGAPAEAVEAMVEQHGPIDDLIAELVPLWERLKSTPDQLPSVAADMTAKCARLRRLWNEHLALEEETVFPAIRRYLDAAALGEMREEMRARRLERNAPVRCAGMCHRPAEVPNGRRLRVPEARHRRAQRDGVAQDVSPGFGESI